MFERFTDRARHVIVLGQEEARGLQHNYIGTEHLLLGLLGERRGLAARALEGFDLSLAIARSEVIDRIGYGKKPMSGHIPFTPRAKRVLELSLREALGLQHHYIGTEHLLLGLIREGEGVGFQILSARIGDLLALRMAVLDLQPAARAGRGPRWRRFARPVEFARPGEPGEPGESGAQAEPGEPGGQGRSGQSGESEELRATPAADSSLSEAARLAGTRPVGSHHLLLAALADPDTAAARALAELGLDLTAVTDALRRADVTGSSDELPEEARRQMQIRVTDHGVVIEATDRMIIELGQAAVRALGGRGRQADESGRPGDPGGSEHGEPGGSGNQGGSGGPGGSGQPGAGEAAQPGGPDRPAGVSGSAGDVAADEPGGTGTIGGNLPAAASLSDVWQALRASLEDISRRAADASARPGEPGGRGRASARSKGSARSARSA